MEESQLMRIKLVLSCTQGFINGFVYNYTGSVNIAMNIILSPSSLPTTALRSPQNGGVSGDCNTILPTADGSSNVM